MDADFLREIQSKGMEIRADEGDARTVEVPLLLRSDMPEVLSKLGME